MNSFTIKLTFISAQFSNLFTSSVFLVCMTWPSSLSWPDSCHDLLLLSCSTPLSFSTTLMFYSSVIVYYSVMVHFSGMACDLLPFVFLLFPSLWVTFMLCFITAVLFFTSFFGLFISVQSTGFLALVSQLYFAAVNKKL